MLAEQTRAVERLAIAADNKRKLARRHRSSIARWQRDTIATPQGLGLIFGGGLAIGLVGGGDTGNSVRRSALGLANIAFIAARIMPTAALVEGSPVSDA